MAKKTMETAEQADKNILVGHLRDLRRQYFNEPTIFYKVGDRVQRGHVKSTIITEIIDNGKIYKVHEVCTQNNYGSSYDYERDDYVAWHDVTFYRTLEENKQIPVFAQRESLQISYQQRCVSGLLTTFYHFGIDMNPDYQRGNVWELEDKVKLIDSIFKNIDIGKFVLIHKPYKEDDASYEMLDGKQRTNAIVEFYENRFSYKGLFFKDLSYGDQDYFENFPIAWGDIREITQKQKYEYFLKLNVSGKPQDVNQIYYVNSLLLKLCTNHETDQHDKVCDPCPESCGTTHPERCKIVKARNKKA